MFTYLLHSDRPAGNLALEVSEVGNLTIDMQIGGWEELRCDKEVVTPGVGGCIHQVDRQGRYHLFSFVRSFVCAARFFVSSFV